MSDYQEVRAEINRLMKFGTKCRLYPTIENKEWDQAYGAGMVSACEDILKVINRAEFEKQVRDEQL